MAGLIVAMFIVFLSPFVAEDIYLTVQERRLKRTERKLDRMLKYHLSEESLTMNVRSSKGGSK